MKKKSAFTFIEVIIAISVFAIGVLAVLRLITQNLVTLDATQSRTTATFLAKEWIELVYNMRDSNISKSLPWDCLLDTQLIADDFGIIDQQKVCTWYFASWVEDHKLLQVSFDPNWYVYATPVVSDNDFDALWSGNILYYTTWIVAGTELFRYSNLPGEWVAPTVFSRYIRFDVVHEWDKVLPSNAILKVESHVLYMKWSKTGEVVLESLIGNY